jgi:hypothetical protein
MSTLRHFVRHSQRLRAVAVAVLALLAIASVAGAAVAGDAVRSHSQKDSARAAAAHAAGALESYGYDDLDALLVKNADLMTPRFRSRYQREVATVLRAAAARRQTRVVTTVTDVAVQTFAGRSARMLVAADRLTYQAGKSSGITPYRFRVRLVESHGGWLVDDISAI